MAGPKSSDQHRPGKEHRTDNQMDDALQQMLLRMALVGPQIGRRDHMGISLQA